MAPSAARSSLPSSRLSANASDSPASASATPSSVRARNGSSSSRNEARMAVYSGITPNSTAVSPDGMYCSPQ